MYDEQDMINIFEQRIHTWEEKHTIADAFFSLVCLSALSYHICSEVDAHSSVVTRRRCWIHLDHIVLIMHQQ